MKITIANEVALARLAIDLGGESTGGSLSLGERPLIAAARAATRPTRL